MSKNKVKRLAVLLFCLLLCFTLSAETVTTEYCLFEVPADMELQEGFFSDISDFFSFDNENLYEAVLQQKGLNSTMESYEGYVANVNAYDDYCRITISCKDGTVGLGELSSYELDYLEDYMYELMSSIYSIPQWNGIKIANFKGYTAYILDYIRGSVAGNEDVHVYNMIISTEAHEWTIIFAARESSLSKWIPSFREFGESFEFGELEAISPQSAISSFEIPGTSQSFYWYRIPYWQTEYSERIRLSNYYDENYDSDGYININITIMDLSGVVSGRIGQLGFLLGIQQQIPMAVLEMMAGLNVRVIENSIDSENSIYTYRYSYSVYGMSFEGIILYSFSESKCVAFTSEWESIHSKAPEIIDAYIAELT